MMLPVQHGFVLPVETPARVACIRDGVVVSIQVIDFAKIDQTRTLFDEVRALVEHEQCGEGWTVAPDGTYVKPPPSEEPVAGS